MLNLAKFLNYVHDNSTANMLPTMLPDYSGPSYWSMVEEHAKPKPVPASTPKYI